MKVLVLLPGKYFESKTGGCVSHTTGVVDALKKLGHEVALCSSDRIPGYTEELLFYQLEVRELRTRLLGRLYRDYHIYRQLKEIINKARPDIIYIRWRQNIFWGRLFKNRNYKVVFECNTPSTMSLFKYGNRPGKLKELFTRSLDRQICRNTDIVSAVSRGVKEFLGSDIRCPSDKIIINPNGVDTGRFTPEGQDVRDKYNIAKDKVVIGYTGSFRPQHGVEVLIEAFISLNDPETVLLIIGTGLKEYEAKLRDLAGKNERIIFTGEVPFDKMPQYLRTCDILVSPQKPFIGNSFHQSPIKLYEYMASGRAITASDLGQIKEVIRDGYNGMLFESGNIDSLVSLLRTLAGDRELRGKLAINARKESIEKYSWENNIKRIFKAWA